MASATQSGTITRETFGSLQIHIIPFSNIDNTNTYASGIKRVVGYWANGTDDPTQGAEKIDVANSSGTLTFATGEDARTGILYVVSEQTV